MACAVLGCRTPLALPAGMCKRDLAFLADCWLCMYLTPPRVWVWPGVRALSDHVTNLACKASMQQEGYACT